MKLSLVLTEDGFESFGPGTVVNIAVDEGPDLAYFADLDTVARSSKQADRARRILRTWAEITMKSKERTGSGT